MFRHRIVFGYVTREMIGPFVLGLVVFTSVLLMHRIMALMDLIINQGVGMLAVLRLVLYLAPSFLVLTIPTALVLAILIALGKLSGDAELIAMKASGISLYQLLPPFALYSIVGFALTALLTLNLMPRGNHAFRDQVVAIARTHTEAVLQEGVFNDTVDGLMVYLERFDRQRQRVQGVLVSDRRDSHEHMLVVAREAVIRSGLEGGALRFELFDGSVHRTMLQDGTYQYALFKNYDMTLPLDFDDSASRRVRHEELALGDLYRLRAEKRAAGQSTARIGIEIHRRFAFPFACLVLSLIGVPLGVSWRRGGRSYGFVASIILVFSYYLIMTFGESLAKSGAVSAWLGMWLPNILFALLGAYLLRLVGRDQPVPWDRLGWQYLEPLVERLSGWLQQRGGGRRPGGPSC